jgi:hypothetical protein
VKRVVVAVLGGILALAGIALLVLPGPGFVLIAAGLAVLATQFDWAKKRLDYATGKATDGIREVTRSPWRMVFAIVCAAGLLVVGVVELTPIDLPGLTWVTAVLLILSGLGLAGTLLYARSPAGRRRLAEREKQKA